MIKFFVEVSDAAAPLRLEVLAESISQAVSSIEELHPGRTVQVVFPIDPQEFFVRDSLKTGAAPFSDNPLQGAEQYRTFGGQLEPERDPPKSKLNTMRDPH